MGRAGALKVLRGVCFAALAGLLAVFAAHFLLTGLVYIRFYFDDNGYHVPMAVEFFRRGDPFAVIGPYLSSYYPALAETLAALVLGIARSVRYSNLTGALCVLGILAVAWRYAGLFSGNRVDRLLVVLAAASMPLLLGQSRAFYNDVHFAFFGVWAAFHLARSIARRRREDAVMALAAGVLTAGVKYSGLFFIATLLPFAVYAWIRGEGPVRKRVWAILAFSGGIAFSWYVRNAVLTGNPLYPFDLPGWAEAALRAVFGRFDEVATLPLSAPSHNSPRTFFPHPFIPEHFLSYLFLPDMTADAFGTVFAIALAAAVARLAVMIRRREGDPAFVATLCFAAAPFVLMPEKTGLEIPRYSFAAGIVLVMNLCFALREGALPSAFRAFLRAALFAYVAAYAVANFFLAAPSLMDLWRYRTGGQFITINRKVTSVRQTVARGGLRIGYLSGSNNFIALLYDDAMTNELVPLHFRDYYFHHGPEKSESEFIDEVRAMKLDHLVVFDPLVPGAEPLMNNFSPLLWP